MSVQSSNRIFPVGKYMVQVFHVPWKHLQITIGLKGGEKGLSLIAGFPMERASRKVFDNCTRYALGPFAVKVYKNVDL